MELTKYAQAIKNQLIEDLLKTGHSLEEFEQALENINTGEGVFKIAQISEKLIEKNAGVMGMAGSVLKGLPEYALKGSLVGGALTGLGLDEMDKSVDSLNKSLEREREKVHLVRRITENLKREHGI
jgi:hypothetical protein